MEQETFNPRDKWETASGLYSGYTGSAQALEEDEYQRFIKTDDPSNYPNAVTKVYILIIQVSKVPQELIDAAEEDHLYYYYDHDDRITRTMIVSINNDHKK